MYQNNIYNWRATVTGVPELLSVPDKKLLGLLPADDDETTEG